MTYTDADVKLLRETWGMKEETEGLCQVGALVVSPENRIVGEGLSKWPPGKHWIDDEDYREFVDQAEVDAINGRDFGGCTLYSTRCPNEDSAECIIKTGIKRVVYIEENHFLKSGLHRLISAKLDVVVVPLSAILRCKR